MFRDSARALADPTVLEERRAMLPVAEQVRALRAWREDLLTRRPGADVPDFDPAEAGVRARVLFIAKAPGRGAAAGDGGSGFVSVDNDDQGAELMWGLRAEAGLGEGEVAHWNAVPWYLGTSSAPPTAADLVAGTKELKKLLPLFPRLEVLVLCGTVAQGAWQRYAPHHEGTFKVQKMPLPDARVMATRTKADDVRTILRGIRSYLGAEMP